MTVPLRGHNWVLEGGQTGRLEAFWVFLLFGYTYTMESKDEMYLLNFSFIQYLLSFVTS